MRGAMATWQSKNMNKILILTSGNVTRLDNFKNYKDVTLGSFSDINFILGVNVIKFKDQDLKEFKIIYFRFVGKSFEIATLISNYAIENGIKIIDRVYENSRLMASSLGKSLELIKLSKAGIPIPITVHGDFSGMPFPYVVKSTTGQRAKEVWLINNEEDLNALKSSPMVVGKFLFAQEFIPNAHRIRSLVVGDRVIGAIIRHTKWNKDNTKETLNPIPEEVINLSIAAAKAADLDICGVDILTDTSNKYWVIEANAAPSWKLINSNCGVNTEDEIIKFIRAKV